MIVHCIDTPNDGGVLLRTPVLTSRVDDGERIWRADLVYGSNLLQESCEGGKNALGCDQTTLNNSKTHLLSFIW